MLIEQWHKWGPASGLSQKYFFDSVVNNHGTFKIRLLDVTQSTTALELELWDAWVNLIQKVPTALRTKSITLLKNEYGKAFIDEWTFFKITKSNLLKALSEQGGLIMNFDNFQHLVLVTTNFVVDIVVRNDTVTAEFINDIPK